MSCPVLVLFPNPLHLIFPVPSYVKKERKIKLEETEQVVDWDELEYQIRLPELMKEKQEECLRNLLKAKGWLEEGEKMRKRIGQVEAECDVRSGKIRLFLSQEQWMKLAKETTIEAGISIPMLLSSFAGLALEKFLNFQEKTIHEKEKKQWERRVIQAKEQMRENIEKELETSAKELQKEMQETVVEYYAEAIRENARNVGEILSQESRWDENREEYVMNLEIRERV